MIELDNNTKNLYIYSEVKEKKIKLKVNIGKAYPIILSDVIYFPSGINCSIS